MNLEETSALGAGQSVEKSRNTSLQKEAAVSANTSTSRLAHTSTSTTTVMGLNGHSTGVDNARVGMDLEKIARQSMGKSGNNSLQKKAPRSATSTSTTTTMMPTNRQSTELYDARVGMDIEEVTGQSMEKSGSNSLQKEAPKSASSTSTSTKTTTTGMQKIDEGNEEEDEILGLKSRNWRKINLSFAIDLNGQEGEDIKETDYYNEGNNNNKMKHHPIMSKLANFIVAVEKKCNTVKVMSSKKKMI
jgi:hypothetical protein